MRSAAIRAARARYAWHGPSLLIVGSDGAATDREPLSGYYYSETRVLRTLRLTVDDVEPWLCEHAAVGHDRLAFNYVYPEITSPGGGGTGQSDDGEHLGPRGIPERALEIRLDFHVRLASLEVGLRIANRSRRAVSTTLGCEVNADFADLLEAQSGAREQTAEVTAGVAGGVLTFAYGHPELPYRSHVRPGPGWRIDNGADLHGPPGHLVAELSLGAGESARLQFTVAADGIDDIDADDAAARDRVLDAWRQSSTRIEIPGNRLAERIVTINVEDRASFAALTGRSDEWLAPQAGMPLYPAFFGRDAVTAGWQAAMLDAGAALDASLTRLGRMQATTDDPWRDAEPGRIPYQMRSGPLARLNINPYSAYYADYASPLMYVISLANLWAWTGDRDCVRRHWDTARAIMDWARRRGDLDGDGYLEYCTRSPKGTKNQGWKDSGDAVVYEDGSPVAPPIATCELQGYWFAAQELMALLCVMLGATADAKAYHTSAADLKARFNRDWWSADERFFALALDPDKRPVRAASSNVGHCLATGIIDREHLAPVVGRLFAPDLFSGWGIRTLTASHRYYDPLSYHRGSVWAVEQGTIVFGLRRFGFDARALDLSRALFDLAEIYPDYRIPECVGGYARAERPVPGAYPRSNTPQLWNATAFPLVVQSLLGLMPLAPASTLMIDPLLPEWMPHVILHGLRVGNARATLEFRRLAGGRVDWDILSLQGTLHVVRQPPPESISATLVDRLGAGFETLRKAI